MPGARCATCVTHERVKRRSGAQEKGPDSSPAFFDLSFEAPYAAAWVCFFEASEAVTF